MKRNVWKDPSPYGTYKGERGNPDQWRGTFEEIWDGKPLPKEEDAWGILGVKKTDTFDVIRAAFKKLIQVHHPDKGGTKEMAQKILAAYFQIKGVMGQ